MSVAVDFTATNGDAYDLHMGRWSQRLAEKFLDFVGVVDGEQVLDLGCGTGSLSNALAKRVKYQGITGIDLSEAYIAHANEQSNDPRLEFRVGSATEVPLLDDSVDRTMALLLLSFVSDTQKAVSEMRRVTRPGGVVAACVWDTRGGHTTNRIFWDTAAVFDPKANELRAENYMRPATRPGELEAAWAEAGLENIEEDMLVSRMDFQSFEDFWSPNLGKQGPIADYVASLEPEAVEQLEEHMRNAYLDGEEDGPRSYAGVAWAIKGTVPTE